MALLTARSEHGMEVNRIKKTSKVGAIRQCPNESDSDRYDVVAAGDP
jgi:hypothetical protein